VVNGALGTLLVGLLSDGSGTGDMKGLFYGGGAKLLGIQTLGVVSVAAFVGVAMTIVFQIIKHTVGLRASAEEELLGMDITEHNLESSYADFMPSVVPHVLGGGKGEESDVPAPKAVPVEVVKRPEIERSSEFKNKYTKLSIICKQNKFEALKTALGDIGVYRSYSYTDFSAAASRRAQMKCIVAYLLKHPATKDKG
jgi:Amt family ammonium transporter